MAKNDRLYEVRQLNKRMAYYRGQAEAYAYVQLNMKINERDNDKLDELIERCTDMIEKYERKIKGLPTDPDEV
jgi:hypothetical protein